MTDETRLTADERALLEATLANGNGTLAIPSNELRGLLSEIARLNDRLAQHEEWKYKYFAEQGRRQSSGESRTEHGRMWVPWERADRAEAERDALVSIAAAQERALKGDGDGSTVLEEVLRDTQAEREALRGLLSGLRAFVAQDRVRSVMDDDPLHPDQVLLAEVDARLSSSPASEPPKPHRDPTCEADVFADDCDCRAPASEPPQHDEQCRAVGDPMRCYCAPASEGETG